MPDLPRTSVEAHAALGGLTELQLSRYVRLRRFVGDQSVVVLHRGEPIIRYYPSGSIQVAGVAGLSPSRRALFECILPPGFTISRRRSGFYRQTPDLRYGGSVDLLLRDNSVFGFDGSYWERRSVHYTLNTLDQLAIEAIGGEPRLSARQTPDPMPLIRRRPFDPLGVTQMRHTPGHNVSAVRDANREGLLTLDNLVNLGMLTTEQANALFLPRMAPTEVDDE